MLWTSFSPRRAGAALVMAMGLAAVPALATAAELEGRFERTLKVSGTVDLSVSSGSGSIRVQPGTSDTVRVVGTIRANRWRNGRRTSGDVETRIKRIEADPPVVQEGSRISIGKTRDDDLYDNISISYDVYVPATTMLSANTGSGSVDIGALRGPVTASSGSGSVQVGAIGGTVKVSSGSGELSVNGAKERVEATTGSGSIHLRNIAGAATANSGSGSIEVEQTASGSVRLTSGSGGIRAWGVRGGLVARASSGSIHVQGTPTEAWDLHTSSGSIDMVLPADAAFTLDAHTGSGSINSDHPITVQGAIDRRTLRGNVRGGGPTITANTSSGSIGIDAAGAGARPK